MNATKAMTLLAATSLAISAQALTLAVKDVKIAQRYPWNGLVDIDYTVECDDKDADVYIYPVGYDADNNQSVALYTFTGEGANGKAVKAGTHRMTWDMAKDMGQNYNRAAFSIKLHGYAGAAPYLVIDLSPGANAEKYEVSYLNEMPEGGWTDEYKSTKLVLKLIPPGTFLMGDNSTYTSSDDFRGGNAKHKVTLTQPYYCGVFEVTYQQWKLITGTEKDGYGNGMLKQPVRTVNYNDLRGATLGAGWPSHQQVDATSFLGKLRSRTGVTFDLPTEAQWEYACRASSSEATSPNPNAFGLYGMNELPGEWCLDWFQQTLSGDQTDPKGPTSGVKDARVVRGGCSNREYSNYISSYSYVGTDNKVKTYSDFWARSLSSSYRCYCAYYSSYPTTPSYSYTGGSYNVYGGGSIVTGSFGCRLVALPAAK